MTAIWQNDNAGWHLLSPQGFPNEATLHTLVENAPHLLPLAGTPRLIVLGREVQLGSGRADLLAIEPIGRLSIIEIKLASNAEARRAVIAQVLAYASYLWGMDKEMLEHEILYKHLQNRGYKSLAHALQSNDQEGLFNPETFENQFASYLKLGHFRLVFVLDEAPDELLRLVNYLATLSEQLVIDVITLSSYSVNGSHILVPQRVEAERPQSEAAQLVPSSSKVGGQLVEGAGDFVASIENAPETSRLLLHRLSNWARNLEQERLVKLQTYHGKKGMLTLLPRLVVDDAGLVSIYNNNGATSLQFWLSVFQRRAPGSLAHIEHNFMPITQGKIIREVSDELLHELTQAYKEANRGLIEVESDGIGKNDDAI